jgi:hypothetical protein
MARSAKQRAQSKLNGAKHRGHTAKQFRAVGNQLSQHGMGSSAKQRRNTARYMRPSFGPDGRMTQINRTPEQRAAGVHRGASMGHVTFPVARGASEEFHVYHQPLYGGSKNVRGVWQAGSKTLMSNGAAIHSRVGGPTTSRRGAEMIARNAAAASKAAASHINDAKRAGIRGR